VQACAELAKCLLEAGPKVKVLASSRDSLRIAGEIVFPVAPLPAPEKGDVPLVDAMMAIDSVRLFVDRSKAVQPAFRLSEDSVRFVAEICRRLDGIPLAIELAAARVRALSVEQIAVRLDDRFRLLNRGDRTALPRQQTLRALIDWSHDLLDAKERALFRRLAVFAGGWTLEAAEEVGAGGEVASEDVLDLLSNLVEKSLVAVDAKSGRYRMLDTVRQYALEKLLEFSEEAGTRERHLAFFLQVVERALPQLFGSEQGTWMARLDLDRENVLAAHEWCDKSPVGAEAGIRLVAALKYYWLNRGLLNQGYAIAHEAINRPAVRSSAAIHCRGLVDVGIIAYFMGRYVEARDQLERGLAVARQLNDRSRQLDVLQLLGPVEFALGNRESALDLCDEAERLARQSKSRRELISSLTAKAQLLRALGRLDPASSLYAEVLALSRDLGDEESVAASLLNLAAVAVLMQQMSAARSMLREVAAITSRIGSRAAGQSLLEVCAGLAAAAGDASRGTEFLNAAEEQAARSGLRRDPADEIFVVDVKRRLQANLVTVATSSEAAMQNSSYDIAIARATQWLDETSVAD
jgi:predicted ATPase